jgi:hypothetical protein
MPIARRDAAGTSDRSISDVNSSAIRRARSAFERSCFSQYALAASSNCALRRRKLESVAADCPCGRDRPARSSRLEAAVAAAGLARLQCSGSAPPKTTRGTAGMQRSTARAETARRGSGGRSETNNAASSPETQCEDAVRRSDRTKRSSRAAKLTRQARERGRAAWTGSTAAELGGGSWRLAPSGARSEREAPHQI